MLSQVSLVERPVISKTRPLGQVTHQKGRSREKRTPDPLSGSISARTEKQISTPSWETLRTYAGERFCCNLSLGRALFSGNLRCSHACRSTLQWLPQRIPGAILHPGGTRRLSDHARTRFTAEVAFFPPQHRTPDGSQSRLSIPSGTLHPPEQNKQKKISKKKKRKTEKGPKSEQTESITNIASLNGHEFNSWPFRHMHFLSYESDRRTRKGSKSWSVQDVINQ